jgi:hypothetical protein
MAWTDKLAEFLRLNDGEQAYVGYPQMQVGLNKPRQAGYATGFLEGATGMNSMQPKNPITDPNFEKYEQGKNTGELANIAAMAIPGYVAALKASAPKAVQMVENYMAKTGGLHYATDPNEYRGSHVAPNAEVYGAPFHALDQLIPKDIYSSQGKRLYGIGDTLIDHDWYMAALKSKGNPEALVEIHRAVPKGITDLNSGDWVTPSKKYAEWHGENALNGEYDIITKKVKAGELASEGYPYELGYNPKK